MGFHKGGVVKTGGGVVGMAKMDVDKNSFVLPQVVVATSAVVASSSQMMWNLTVQGRRV